MSTPTHYQVLANELKDILGLTVAPIAITFHESPPPGVAAIGRRYPAPASDGRTGAVAAGCLFWMEALNKTFATMPDDHGNCSVGCLTHGLKTVQQVVHNSDVKAACEVGWVSPDAVANMTVVRAKAGCITYGPLADSSFEDSVILIRLNGKQQMFLHDAWPSMKLEGKPQCHIIAIAKERAEVAMSVGCMLSRVRTGMSNNEVTCAIPSSILPQLIDRLKIVMAANNAVASYAAQDAKRFASPGPSVRTAPLRS